MARGQVVRKERSVLKAAEVGRVRDSIVRVLMEAMVVGEGPVAMGF